MNLREFGSRMYHTNVFSSARVNWYRLLYVSLIEVRLFIRVMIVVRDTSYIFAMRRIDIIRFIQRVSIIRLILASLELIGILYGHRKLQSRPKVVVVVKSGPCDWLAYAMYNHVIVIFIIKIQYLGSFFLFIFFIGLNIALGKKLVMALNLR